MTGEIVNPADQPKPGESLEKWLEDCLEIARGTLNSVGGFLTHEQDLEVRAEESFYVAALEFIRHPDSRWPDRSRPLPDAIRHQFLRLLAEQQLELATEGARARAQGLEDVASLLEGTRRTADRLRQFTERY